jgi:peptidoglycan/xylan/chitin deacetylase (PgdA/CDA1 family)
MGKTRSHLSSVIWALAAGLGISAFGIPWNATASAADCPGHPNAIGTSRVLTLDPASLPRIGVMQYPDTLPLNDHEVVLTFDDGPLPKYSSQVLDTLAEQCVKATYFLVGEMAHNFPAMVRRIYLEGHTIGTHSQDHPFRFAKLSPDKQRAEIDDGIANVTAALGDPHDIAPFFRFPGLGRTDISEQELASHNMVVWSSDTVADDWHRHIRPAEIIHKAISRLEARGKGILLLHDIHQATATALPEILKQLKEHGFRIVHVVPGPADDIAVASSHHRTPAWPKIAAIRPFNTIVLDAPDEHFFAVDYRPWRSAKDNANAAEAGLLSTQALAQWPDADDAALTSSGPCSEGDLPAPSLDDIGPALE